MAEQQSGFISERTSLFVRELHRNVRHFDACMEAHHQGIITDRVEMPPTEPINDDPYLGLHVNYLMEKVDSLERYLAALKRQVKHEYGPHDEEQEGTEWC